MNSPDQDNKARNREIAQNEAEREKVSAIRVSGWAIGLAVLGGLIAFGIGWAWLHR